jgi:hypothetical protein
MAEWTASELSSVRATFDLFATTLMSVLYWTPTENGAPVDAVTHLNMQTPVQHFASCILHSAPRPLALTLEPFGTAAPPGGQARPHGSSPRASQVRPRCDCGCAMADSHSCGCAVLAHFLSPEMRNTALRCAWCLKAMYVVLHGPPAITLQRS